MHRGEAPMRGHIIHEPPFAHVRNVVSRFQKYELTFLRRMKAKYTFELYTNFPFQTMEQLAPILKEAPRSSYKLKVIDIAKHPEVLEEKKLLWAPVLIKVKPLPRQIFAYLENIKAGLAAILEVPYKALWPGIKPEPHDRRPSPHHEQHHAAPTMRDAGMGARAGGHMLVRDVIIEKERAKQ